MAEKPKVSDFQSLESKKVYVTDCCGLQVSLTVVRVEEYPQARPEGAADDVKPFSVTFAGPPHAVIHEGLAKIQFGEDNDDNKIVFEDVFITVHGAIDDKDAPTMLHPVFQADFQ